MKQIKSNMSGTISKVSVKVGDTIEDSAEIVILESMKMEIPINSDGSGTVKEINVSEGDFVNDGDVIAVIE